MKQRDLKVSLGYTVRSYLKNLRKKASREKCVAYLNILKYKKLESWFYLGVCVYVLEIKISFIHAN